MKFFTDLPILDDANIVSLNIVTFRCVYRIIPSLLSYLLLSDMSSVFLGFRAVVDCMIFLEILLDIFHFLCNSSGRIDVPPSLDLTTLL